jgi:hypothetical protein
MTEIFYVFYVEFIRLRCVSSHDRVLTKSYDEAKRLITAGISAGCTSEASRFCT